MGGRNEVAGQSGSAGAGLGTRSKRFDADILFRSNTWELGGTELEEISNMDQRFVEIKRGR